MQSYQHYDELNFSLEAVVTCDDRGQLVLPKDIRKKLKILPGEKLAVLKMANDKGHILTLIKANALESVIKGFMEPVMKDAIK